MTAGMQVVKMRGVTLIRHDCMEILGDLGPVDHVITDPPYEQSLHDAKSSGRKLRRDGGGELKPLDFEGIDAIRAPFVDHVAEICSGWLLAFCTIEGSTRWADVINPSPIRYKRACVWVKPDSAPQMNGQGPAAGTECFVAAWCGRGVSRWNGGGKRNVYTHNTNGRTRTGLHPTEKPLSLMAEMIADFTNPGDLILDPFMGVGTTVVAAMMAGRRAIGIERDPAYFKAALARVRDEKRRMAEAPRLIDGGVWFRKQEALL